MMLSDQEFDEALRPIASRIDAIGQPELARVAEQLVAAVRAEQEDGYSLDEIEVLATAIRDAVDPMHEHTLTHRTA